MNNNENNKRTNTISIVGFILSFFIGIIGLILSIIGLKKSKEYNSGKGLSIAGIIISTLNIIATIFILIISLLFYSTFNMFVKVKDKVIDIGNDLTNEYLCSISYECKENNNGWTCKYENEIGEVKEVNCDYNNDYNKINEQELVGKWKPKRVENYSEYTTVDEYFGEYSKEEDFGITFNEDNTYKNSLNSNEISGQYKISLKNIILDNNENFTLRAEIIEEKIDCLVLTEVDGTIIYLYKDIEKIVEETEIHNTNTIKYKYFINEIYLKELKELNINGNNVEINDTIYFSDYQFDYNDEFFIINLETSEFCGKSTHNILIYDYEGNLLLENKVIDNDKEFDTLIYSGNYEFIDNKLILSYDTNRDFDCNTSNASYMSCDELNSIKDIVKTKIELEYTYKNKQFINEKEIIKEYLKDSVYYEKYSKTCK